MVPSSLSTGWVTNLHPDTQHLKSSTTQLSHSGSFEDGSVLQILGGDTAVGGTNIKSPME